MWFAEARQSLPRRSSPTFKSLIDGILCRNIMFRSDSIRPRLVRSHISVQLFLHRSCISVEVLATFRFGGLHYSVRAGRLLLGYLMHFESETHSSKRWLAAAAMNMRDKAPPDERRLYDRPCAVRLWHLNVYGLVRWRRQVVVMEQCKWRVRNKLRVNQSLLVPNQHGQSQFPVPYGMSSGCNGQMFSRRHQPARLQLIEDRPHYHG